MCYVTNMIPRMVVGRRVLHCFVDFSFYSLINPASLGVPRSGDTLGGIPFEVY